MDGWIFFQEIGISQIGIINLKGDNIKCDHLTEVRNGTTYCICTVSYTYSMYLAKKTVRAATGNAKRGTSCMQVRHNRHVKAFINYKLIYCCDVANLEVNLEIMQLLDLDYFMVIVDLPRGLEPGICSSQSVSRIFTMS